MTKAELIKMGFTNDFLDRAFKHKGQKFAWRAGASEKCNMLFDTAEFDKYRLSLCGTGR